MRTRAYFKGTNNCSVLLDFLGGKGEGSPAGIQGDKNMD